MENTYNFFRGGKEKSEKEIEEERMSAGDTGIDSDDSDDTPDVKVVSRVTKSCKNQTQPVKHQTNKNIYFGDLDTKLQNVRKENFNWISNMNI